MEDYYSILGVSPSDDQETIKRVFRKLAVQYHPDKNPDSAAEQRFKAMTEAYEVLSDPEKRKAYDLRRWFGQTILEDTQPRHRDPAYRRRRPHTRHSFRNAQSRRMQLILEYLPYARRVIHISLGFCLLLLADYMFPFEQTRQQVEETWGQSKSISRQRHSARFFQSVRTNHNISFRVKEADAPYFKRGDQITVLTTRILGIPLKAVTAQGRVCRLPATIYANLLFAPALLLIMSVIGVVVKGEAELQFNLGVACFFILLLSIVFVR